MLLDPEVSRFALKAMIFLDTEAAIRYEYLYRVLAGMQFLRLKSVSTEDKNKARAAEVEVQ